MHHVIRCLLLMVPAIGGLALRLSAQAPADRIALERFRDSVAAIGSVAELERLEAELIGAARVDRDNALLHLRLGFVALALGGRAATGEARRHYDDAAGEFEWATQVQPEWPYGWYGLGLAELGVGDDEVLLVAGFQTMLGKDALTRSANAFARSAEVDPGFELGLVELSATALRQRINSRLDVALAALRRAGRTAAGERTAVLLARGRVERVAGSLDSSAAALARAWAHDSSQPVVRYEMARTGFLRGDTLAAANWYAALASGDSAVTALARDDLGPILPDTTRLTFDAATPTARVALMRTFWDRRDDHDLRPHGARLAEHFRRLDYARRAYRLVVEHRQFDIVERYRSGQVEYDDRGLMYIRHGEPDERAEYNAPGIEPNESWLYHRPDGDLILHFVARQDVQDFRLVESVLDVLGFATVVSLQDAPSLRADARSGELARHVDGLLRSREPLSPIYSRLLGAGQSGAAQLRATERDRGHRAIERAATSDSWPLRFERELAVDAVTVRAGADSGGNQLQFAFALPEREASDSAGPAPVRTRLVVQRLDGELVAQLDTTERFVVSPGREGRLLGHYAVGVGAGRFTVHSAIETDRGGAVSAIDTVDLVAPLGPHLGMSDVILGSRSVPLTWRDADGENVWLNPTPVFARHEMLELYAEVTGLPRGMAYQIELKVRKPGGGLWRKIFGGGTALELKFPADHPGGIDRIHREVSLSKVSPGEYRLEVTVHAADGQEVSRWRTVTIQ